MGVRVLLDPSLAPALAAAGLSSPHELFRLGGAPEARSVVTTIDREVPGTVGRFHVKRYHYPDWGASRGLLGRGTLFGRAPEVNEFKALAFLRQKGVPAVRPVAAASRTHWGRLADHVLVTEHVPDTENLETRLRTPGDPVREEPAVRRRVLRLVARHLERMHVEGFVHRDCHARNVLVRTDGEDARIWFCDCRRGGGGTWRIGPWHDLATLDQDLAGRVPATDRLRALGTWLTTGAASREAHERVVRLAGKLRRKAARRAARHRA